MLERLYGLHHFIVLAIEIGTTEPAGIGKTALNSELFAGNCKESEPFGDVAFIRQLVENLYETDIVYGQYHIESPVADGNRSVACR